MAEHILIVDDEESIRFTFSRFLEGAGYRVSAVGTLEKAIALLDENDFDLIFADILLGGQRGQDLLIRVREMALSSPMVMITGYPNVQSAAEAVRLGAYDYISKPVRQDTLLRISEKALQFKRLTDEKRLYQANLDAIFRSVTDAVITLDGHRILTACNAATEKICGFTSQKVGQRFDRLELPCRRQCLEALEAAFRNKEAPVLHHIRCHREDRAQQVVSVRTSPLLSAGGESIGAVMVVRDETRLNALERDLQERTGYHRMVGRSPKMQDLYALVEKLAEVPTTVLITGESGTGKELVAEALHFQGPRREGPLVKVNCAALSETLLETELFGHVKGAFSGAVRDNVGRFERANGGTIFLDEVGDISPALQTRLLRVLQEKVIERVGDPTPIPVDVRVVAATNQDLEAKIRRGEFREDLFYRIKVVHIEIPPLRERRMDIPLLVEHYLDYFGRKLQRSASGVMDSVLERFMNYPWRGNVRELEHALEHALILCHDSLITLEHLPKDLLVEREASSLNSSKNDEPEQLREALALAGGNKAKAARLLGISRRTIYRKISEYGLIT